ncbi:MAG TPA: efflux RND transporter periplasmic adaptor subunit [Gemmatimonadales bacterium]|nr:efflux RND transporter periplasmic adaptor subunit [Gemmatimonadales bacterium]
MTATSSRSRRWLPIGIAVIVVAVAVLWWWQRPEAATDSSPHAEMAGMEGMEGMAMPAADGSVRLSAEMLRTFGVTFGTVAMRTLTDTVRAVGEVRWDETRVSQVSSRVMGYIERLPVAATGQRVRRGDTLLALYAPEVVAALEELRAGQALDAGRVRAGLPGIPGSRTDLVASARERLLRWDVPTEVIDRVVAGGAVPRTVPLLAPVSGIVIDKAVQLGQAVSVGERLYTIVDPSVVWVDVEFREVEASALAVGRTALVSFTGSDATPRPGRVSFVYPTIDPVTRTIRARIVLDNPGTVLQDGRFAQAEVVAPVRTELSVPASAVIATGTGHVVFRDAGDGRLEPLEVTVGPTIGGATPIRSGLADGDRVVTSAQYLLEAESNLGAVMRSMLGQMGGGGMAPMPGMPADSAAPAPHAMPGMPGMPGMSMPGDTP